MTIKIYDFDVQRMIIQNCWHQHAPKMLGPTFLAPAFWATFLTPLQKWKWKFGLVAKHPMPLLDTVSLLHTILNRPPAQEVLQLSQKYIYPC